MFYENAVLVKVVKSSFNTFWYSNKIGKEYWARKNLGATYTAGFEYEVLYACDGDNISCNGGWFDENDIEIIRTANVEIKTEYTLTEV